MYLYRILLCVYHHFVQYNVVNDSNDVCAIGKDIIQRVVVGERIIKIKSCVCVRE